MSESKHTPGPWAVRHSFLDERELEVHPVFEGPPENGDWVEIATVRDAYGEDLEDGLHECSETAANARLIAAAPDLKSELERLREIVVDAVARGMIETCPEVDAALHCSAEAIAKAEGISNA